MRNLRHCLCLADHSQGKVLVGRQLRWQNFQGNRTLEPFVLGKIDLAHSTTPQELLDRITILRFGRKRLIRIAGRPLSLPHVTSRTRREDVGE